MVKFICLFLVLIFASWPAFAKAPFERGVVVSKNQLASEAGAQVLSSGGNAIDAAVATAYALGVVEPWACGVGGGGFALIYLAKTKTLKAIDFRERAPTAINSYPYEFRDGPKAGGIPGTVAGLEYMRKKYGLKNRGALITPAINYASQGFPVSKTIHRALTNRQKVLNKYPSSSKIFLPDNGELPVLGQTLKNPELANTLKQIRRNGESTFYRGQLARQLSRQIKLAGGFMSQTDLQNYQVYEWAPVCGDYRDAYRVCSFPLPSSGGTCIIEALNILENFDLPSLDYRSPERLHYLIEALRFSFADRATKLGDPRFNLILAQELTSQNYANSIADRIRQSKQAIPSKGVFALDEKPQTTHFTVADKDGNVVALTFSLNGYFGSGFVVPGTGIVLNNTLDDFSLQDSSPNQFGLIGNTLNAPAPGKTPLSSMSPTIVFDKQNKPILALGSPGGPTIISAVLNTLLAFTDSHMSLPQAVAAGRVHHQWQPDHVYSEELLIDEQSKKQLTEKYNYVFPTKENSVWKQLFWTVEAVELNWGEHQLIGASDPRAEQGIVFEDNVLIKP
jgi:gamma-glutamyltranspeptidase / glutathione hydrolase